MPRRGRPGHPRQALTDAARPPLGLRVTGLGVVIASRIATFEGFGSISNDIIQPLYFLSRSISLLKGVIEGVGFLDLPDELRTELRWFGIYALSGGWVVQLPVWLQVLVYVDPLSYQLDLLRYVVLGYRQLPMPGDLAVACPLPLAAGNTAAAAVSALRKVVT